MRVHAWHLVNSAHVEAWPAQLLRARGNVVARALSAAEWCLRRKRDGAYLAAWGPAAGLVALRPGGASEPGVHAALAAIQGHPGRAGRQQHLPLQSLLERLARIGLAPGAEEARGLDLVAEPCRLEFAGRDRYRRPLWLLAPAARAWRRMQAAARDQGIALEAISGYRSHDYQLGIFERKFARGLALADILAVNAAPGYSEHHGGCALDIGTPGEPAAEESFEATPAFAWLQAHAAEFGFDLSYPRGNRHGIVYEPWHWCWRPASPGSA